MAGPRLAAEAGVCHKPADRLSAPLEGSVRVLADALVALVDHARAEGPGFDQIKRDVFYDRRQERRAATDHNGIAEHAQFVDEAELDSRSGQAGAADRDVLVGCVQRRSRLLGHRCLGEPGISLDAVECAAEDDLRDLTPDVGKRGPGLVVAQRRIRLPHQHRVVEPAAEEIPAELAYLREVKAEQLVARRRPPERAVAVGDEAIHRNAHRVDQHGFRASGRSDRRWSVMRSTLRLDIGLSFLLRCRPARRSPWEPNRPPAGYSEYMTVSLAMAP